MCTKSTFSRHQFKINVYYRLSMTHLNKKSRQIVNWSRFYLSLRSWKETYQYLADNIAELNQFYKLLSPGVQEPIKIMVLSENLWIHKKERDKTPLFLPGREKLSFSEKFGRLYRQVVFIEFHHSYYESGNINDNQFYLKQISNYQLKYCTSPHNLPITQ